MKRQETICRYSLFVNTPLTFDLLVSTVRQRVWCKVQLKDTIKKSSVIVIGCGNSPLTFDLPL